MMKQTILIFAVMFLLSNFAHAEAPTAAQLKFFETNIRPALVKYCYECHSVDEGESRAGLLVDSRHGLLQGGDSGAAIVPGKPDQSLLWEAINWDGYEMPPSQKMPATVIANFEKWIAMGAPDPREQKKLVHQSKISKQDIEKGKEHWAFQPPTRESGASIDSMVAARLREEGLNPAPPADAMTLLRRINFSLIGLPPSPTEIQAFATAYKKNADAAVEAKVDALLKSPHYGERWGRHWMDVARYAESSGSRSFSYPHAWRYRDFVIDAFNKDTPYDRFLAQQISGDLLPAKTDEAWQENLIATGFLAIGMKHLDEKNPRKFMADVVDEQIDTVTQAVLGLTVACARCHDHRYDPIPTEDYYAMAGIFRSTKTYYGTQPLAQNHRPGDLLLLPIPDKVSAEGSGGGRGRGMPKSVESLKSRLAGIEEEMKQQRSRRIKDGIEKGDARKERKELLRIRERMIAELATLNSDGSKKTFGMGVQEAKQMVNADILIGGEVEKPAQEVNRGFLQVLGDLNFQAGKSESSGRKELVKSITSKHNPLTARVMVNRIWMHLIGRPIVGTPNNFGFSGTAPENQELLDYLAVRFMQEGWSVKRVIREIMLTDTYRRSARYDEHCYEVDPDNTMLWRSNPRALDAESLRDAMLAASGLLDPKKPFASAVAVAGEGKTGGATIDPNVRYRSVYLPIVRDEVIEPLDLFDFPDANMSCAGRQASIVPTQALYMMNGEFIAAQAQAMAANLEDQFSTTNEQIRNAFLRAYGRQATKEELQASAQFFREFKPTQPAAATENAAAQSPRPKGRRKNAQAGSDRPQRGGRRNAPETAKANKSGSQALAVFCQTLMASARFRILN